MQGNASKHKAMSYGRMCESEEKLKAEVEELLRQAKRRMRPRMRRNGEDRPTSYPTSWPGVKVG